MVNGSILNWIKDFLCNRTQNVLLKGQHSGPCPVLSGVPQGTVLGPLLFLLYIKMIFLILFFVHCRSMYADDTVADLGGLGGL